MKIQASEAEDIMDCRERVSAKDDRLDELLSQCLNIGKALVQLTADQSLLDAHEENDQQDGSLCEVQLLDHQSKLNPCQPKRSLLPGRPEDLVARIKMQYITLANLFRVAIADFKDVQANITEVDLPKWCLNQHLILNLSQEQADQELGNLQRAVEILVELGDNLCFMLITFQNLLESFDSHELGYSMANKFVDPLIKTVRESLRSLVAKSFLIDRQPPRVLSANTKFSIRGRFLVGSKFGLKESPPLFKAYIVNEARAKDLMNGDCISIFEEEAESCRSGFIVKSEARAEYDEDLNQMCSMFDGLYIYNLQRRPKIRGLPMTKEKFCLIITSNVHIESLGKPINIQV